MRLEVAAADAMEEDEADIDRLPIDLLAYILSMVPSFTDLAQASEVCRRWKKGVKLSYGRRDILSFAGWKMDDDSAIRIVRNAYSLKELDILFPGHFYSCDFSMETQELTDSITKFADKFWLLVRSRSRWGCQISDRGLCRISTAKCIRNLTSISLWGMTGINDAGIVQLITRANSLRHLNLGGTFVTDESLVAVAESCPQLKTIGLWCCRHVTRDGLAVLVTSCSELKSINVWGTRVPPDCFADLIHINPDLKIKA